MALLRFIAGLVAFYAFLADYRVFGQFAQDAYEINLQGGARGLLYQPTAADQPSVVLELDPKVVVLTYNCYYMKDICVNAYNFMNYRRDIHPTSNLPKDWFVYDFNTGRGMRSDKRRDASCPGSWKDRHPCPEPNQRVVMRNDGPWRYTELEDNTDINEIRNIQLPNGGKIYSNLRYTCDEFPPATWIEGGDGEDHLSSAETRCAAFRCKGGTKGEQNWQGTAHRRLRDVLTNQIKEKKRNNPTFALTYSKTTAKTFLATFNFNMINQADGIAARVTVYQDPDFDTVDQAAGREVTQAKRGMDGVNGTHHRRALAVKPERLAELLKLGHATEHLVHANESDSSELGSMADMTGTAAPMSWLGMDRRWLDDEDDEDEDFQSTNANKRQSTPQNSTESFLVPAAPLLKNASMTDIEKARKLVEQAITESSKRNAARLLNPLRNQYRLKPGTVTGQPNMRMESFNDNGKDETPVTPLLDITDDLAAAAALVAEADAVGKAGNLTRRTTTKRATGSYWMGSIDHKGSVPWGGDASYKVFRNVRDYGAVGDGVTDDTKAFKNAMSDGKRCAVKCNGSTVKNAIVYIPPGTYVISSTIAMPFGTQVIGDANARPTLKASKSFIGMGVLSTDEYTGGGTGTDGLDQQYFVNTANFYRQLRNLIIDVTQTRASQKVACLHYQVAQATSTQNLLLIAGSSGYGMYAENGSGGQISDVEFQGGAVGLFGGSQQFTAQRLKFSGCTVGVQLIWDWGWVWKSIEMNNVGTGFKLVPDSGSGSSGGSTAAPGNIGSASFLDSSFNNVKTVVVVEPPSKSPGSGTTGLVLENIKLSGVSAAVVDNAGATILGASSNIDQWTYGPTYKGSADTKDRDFVTGTKVGDFRRHSKLLDGKGAYFERAKPQYEDRSVGDFVHLKDLGARGDGVTDDTAAFQSALYAAVGKILFIDAGSYILTSTVTVPSGSKLVGETWSQLAASGPYFSDALNPKVMLKVGTSGQVGDVEMQDLLFTTVGPTAGAILVEWNIQASSPGAAGLWDCHARIGGAMGTKLTPAECPPLTSGTAPGCNAASLMMHLTKTGSGYFENMWLWGSDHMIDDPDMNDANNTMVQNSVYVARGFLIESVQPTWLYGTASEHAVFYQYNFNKAANIFAGLIQTESPYYQPTPQPPAPFTSAVGIFAGDPTYKCAAGDEFSGCDESWAVIIRESMNIFIASAGLYSWFSTYAQTCIDQQLCQKALMLLEKNHANVRINHLVTIGAKYMAVMDGKGIPPKTISTANGSLYDEFIWIDPKIWDMDKPKFTCSPPCKVKIPPWTKATSTVNYPLITVSDGTWTSTITKAPITISQWWFEAVTLSGGNGAAVQRRQGFEPFWPVPEKTSAWPAVVYTGPDGSSTIKAPTIPFPTPPPSIGPDTPPPPTGSWPKRQLEPYAGQYESPLVEQCSFWDQLCLNKPWLYGDNSTYLDDGGADDDDYDEDWKEALTTCPIRTKTSSSSSSSSTKTTTKAPDPTTTRQPDPPAPSPREGDPQTNKLRCYGGLSQRTEHVRIDNTIRSYCNALGSRGTILGPNFFNKQTFTLPQGSGTGVEIVMSITVHDGCQWKWNFDECKRYFLVPVDSCNCGGKDGKQGGVVSNDCYDMRLDPNTVF
ncbi:hypothetical protein P3342_012751 [Pyrenophora teres f. teres]|nr:hypothetical protein P3342_012751 [Pyrenophora teres f. teres]